MKKRMIIICLLSSLISSAMELDLAQRRALVEEVIFAHSIDVPGSVWLEEFLNRTDDYNEHKVVSKRNQVIKLIRGRSIITIEMPEKTFHLTVLEFKALCHSLVS